jgi:hypothetical protein
MSDPGIAVQAAYFFIAQRKLDEAVVLDRSYGAIVENSYSCAFLAAVLNYQ